MIRSITSSLRWSKSSVLVIVKNNPSISHVFYIHALKKVRCIKLELGSVIQISEKRQLMFVSLQKVSLVSLAGLVFRLVCRLLLRFNLFLATFCPLECEGPIDYLNNQQRGTRSDGDKKLKTALRV